MVQFVSGFGGIRSGQFLRNTSSSNPLSSFTRYIFKFQFSPRGLRRTAQRRNVFAAAPSVSLAHLRSRTFLLHCFLIGLSPCRFFFKSPLKSLFSIMSQPVSRFRHRRETCCYVKERKDFFSLFSSVLYSVYPAVSFHC